MKKNSKRTFKNKNLLALEKSYNTYSNNGQIKICLVYPNTYKAGMSSLGFQTLFSLISSLDQVSCERGFLPEKFRSGKIIAGRSFESNTKLSSFDIIAFSISFENDYINLVSLLQDSGIPLRSSGRNKFHPLVIAGGISCFLNPEPIAPFLDCILLGEAENFIKQFFEIFSASNTREEMLENLARNLTFAYIPSFYEFSTKDTETVVKVKPIHKYAKPTLKVNYVQDIDKISTTSSILTSQTTFKNIFLIETGRGCPHGCRFCSAGFIYRPPRFYSKNNIFDSIKKGKTLTDKIGFVSAAVSDHPSINKICEKALEFGLKPSFSSFRADALSRNVLNSIGKSSVKTATIAPEAGSQKMRDVINKNISETEILNCTEYLVSSGIINLKLYFLIGLPFEEDNDINEIVILIKKIKQTFLSASKKQKKIGTITISINPFIPKPSTPFQWAGFSHEKILKDKINFIKNSLKKVANLVIKTESIKQAKINAFLSRADRKAADVLETANESGWTSAIKDNKAYIDSIVYRTWDTNIDLPWDIIDTGLKKSFLIKEFKRAKLAKSSPPCPLVDCEKCSLCKQT